MIAHGKKKDMSTKFHPKCHFNYVHSLREVPVRSWAYRFFVYIKWLVRKEYGYKNELDSCHELYIIRFTMSRSKPPRSVDTKAQALRDQGALHPHPEAVHDEVFRSDQFFDARDLVQVRYEMLRRHRIEGRPVTEVAALFGVSRQAFYVTEATFEDQGLPGLLPRRRGPKRAHKCTEEILNFVEQRRETASTEAGESEAQAIARRFGVKINPRSIDRALARRKKKPLARPEKKR